MLLVCPYCRSTFCPQADVLLKRGLGCYNKKCSHYGIPDTMFEIDHKMQPILFHLWDMGIETFYSCNGHYSKSVGFHNNDGNDNHIFTMEYGFSRPYIICNIPERFKHHTVQEDLEISIQQYIDDYGYHDITVSCYDTNKVSYETNFNVFGIRFLPPDKLQNILHNQRLADDAFKVLVLFLLGKPFTQLYTNDDQ